MTESNVRIEVPVAASIPVGTASLESILCTKELRRRPFRPPDYGNENRAVFQTGCSLGSGFGVSCAKLIWSPPESPVAQFYLTTRRVESKATSLTVSLIIGIKNKED